MNILALDLSLTATGYAASDGCSGVLRPPKGFAGLPRQKWILNAVWQRAQHADVIAIEGYSFGSQGRAVFDIAELGGIVRFTLYRAFKTVVEIPPANLKLFATGKGNAKKDEVLAYAIRQLKYNGSDHNEADALWLLELTRAHYEHRTLTETKERALAKIDWPALWVSSEERTRGEL